MTSEERFIRIENALQTVSENQAGHEAAIRDLIVVSRTLLESQKETTTQIRELKDSQSELTEAQRGLTEAHRELDDEYDRKMAEWRELSADTEAKLNALIETVDRIIGKKNGRS